MACSQAGSWKFSGADALAETLLRQTQRPTVFLVTGNQNLPLVDALGRREVRLVHARHESGAGYMAEGWARSSAEPGIYVVTAGPGLTSALTPLASARLAEVPVILLSASHPRSQDGMGAFQELAQTRLTGPLCKAAARCLQAAQAGPLLEWAWRQATAFPPGPVHLELPADVLTEPIPPDLTQSPARPSPRATAPAARSPAAGPGRDVIRQAARLLTEAKRPLVLLRPALGRCPEASWLRRRIPTLVVESPRGLRDPAWAGEQELIATADHIVILGPPDYAVDFGQIGSAHVHVVPDADPAILSELASLLAGRSAASPPAECPPATIPGHVPGPMHPLAVAAEAGNLIRGDDVLVVDGGEFCQWVRHGVRHLANSQLLNGKLGAIGGSIPLAVGASLHSRRRHLVFIGDGSFGYYSAEIGTAVSHGALMTIVAGVDGCWGSEWHQQARRYGGRAYATEIGEPRYDLVAQGYGAQARLARDCGEFHDALAWALGSAGVTCVSVRIRREASPAA